MNKFFQVKWCVSSFKVALALNCALLLNGSLVMAESTPINNSGSLSLENGTYLYGESSKANQTGQGYVVFSKQGQQVIGAFYYPQSEFSCFTGTIKQQHLAVLSLGFSHESTIDVEVPLTQMHQIPAVGTNTLESLGQCQQEIAAYQKQQQIAAPLTQWNP